MKRPHPAWYDPKDPRSPKEQHAQYQRDAEVSLPELLSLTAEQFDERESVWAQWREFRFSLTIWDKDEFNPKYGAHVEAIADAPLDDVGRTVFLSYAQHFIFPGDAIRKLNEFVDQMLTFGAMFNYDRLAKQMLAVVKASNATEARLT